MKPIRSQKINSAMIIATAVLMLMLAISSIMGSMVTREVNQLIDRMEVLHQSAHHLQDNSDYLTEQVRLYVVTGQKQYCLNYYHKAHQISEGDDAMENILQENLAEEAQNSLKSAMQLARLIIKDEEYAMKLTLETLGEDQTDYPSRLISIVIDESDQKLTADQKKELAREMVFGRQYVDRKQQIRDNVQSVIDLVYSSINQQKQTAESRRLTIVVIQNILASLTFIMVAIFISFHTQFLVKPLAVFTSQIENQQPLPEKGSLELQQLAAAYNSMMKQIQSDQIELSYEASHDALTGLYNRKIFDEVRNSSTDASMLLIDVDHFKTINDTYGHETGDNILKKVANVLQHNFRHEDYICRIGGDEFAIIMQHVDSSLKELIEGKITAISAQLADCSDGLPESSLSIGIAFADRKDPGGDIYADCDKALYAAKQAGKNTHCYY